jgi:hypothetical protein
MEWFSQDVRSTQRLCAECECQLLRFFFLPFLFESKIGLTLLFSLSLSSLSHFHTLPHCSCVKLLHTSMTSSLSIHVILSFIIFFSHLLTCLVWIELHDWRWFHGFLSSEEVDRLLDSQPIGTYLVRFSRSNNGSYAIAFVDQNRRVSHSLVRYCPPNGYSIIESDDSGESNKVFNSLEALIKNYSYVLKTPFISTLSREPYVLILSLSLPLLLRYVTILLPICFHFLIFSPSSQMVSRRFRD